MQSLRREKIQINDIKKGKIFKNYTYRRLEFRFWKSGNESCRLSSETWDPSPLAPAFLFGARGGRTHTALSRGEGAEPEPTHGEAAGSLRTHPPDGPRASDCGQALSGNGLF